ILADACIEKLVDDPREDELASRNALEDLTVDDEAVFELRIRRHAEGEVMTDARLEVVRVHPLGERGAVGQRAPDRLGCLRELQLSPNCLLPPFLPFPKCPFRRLKWSSQNRS